MLRARFHGRGGQGVKTASRILGSAAFLAGFQVQDFPVYGAERRGAPVAAYTRIDRQPICERGVILAPDLLIVADETLLADASAGVLVGSEATMCLLVNSPHPAASLADHYRLACPVLTLDLTARAAAALGKPSALSAPVGAAACALMGLLSAQQMADAIRQELGEVGLAPEDIEANVTLGHGVFTELTLQSRMRTGAGQAAASPVSPAASLHPPEFIPGWEGAPVILAPGNSARRHTGSWRLVRPVIDRAACTRCLLCVVHCPDGAISLNGAGYPVIDYDNCKGCMLCAADCPLGVIHEEREAHAW